jgi:metallophosphoesterase (TIGR00282 family)
MRILFIGDIFGRPGRELARHAIRVFRRDRAVDFVVANVENAAAGFGITRDLAEMILDDGVDVMTSGNHIWDKKEVFDYIDLEPRLLRPANFPAGVPGHGVRVTPTAAGPVAVINVMGRVFMSPIDDPFAVVNRELEALDDQVRVIVVDFHAEATSEKLAMGWHLDGRVTAVVGTHTHVQTADARLLPAGTAYITDVGMTGPHDSVIGIETSAALRRFLRGLPARWDAATANPRFNAVLIEVDGETGRARTIERLDLAARDLDALADGTTRTRQ